MRTTTRENYAREQKQKALGMLQALQERIQNGELIVDTFGFWQGMAGTWTFKVSAKESDNRQALSES